MNRVAGAARRVPALVQIRRPGGDPDHAPLVDARAIVRARRGRTDRAASEHGEREQAPRAFTHRENVSNCVFGTPYSR